MRRIVLGSGILRRDNAILLVQCRYDGEPEPLWTLPGGRQEPGELIEATTRREFQEEASLSVDIGDLAYLSESVDADADLHVVNCTFWVRESDASAQPLPADPKVVAARFVPLTDAPALLRADVLRIPVAAALNGMLQHRYFSFDSANIKVPFFSNRAKRSMF